MFFTFFLTIFLLFIHFFHLSGHGEKFIKLPFTPSGRYRLDFLGYVPSFSSHCQFLFFPLLTISHFSMRYTSFDTSIVNLSLLFSFSFHSISLLLILLSDLIFIRSFFFLFSFSFLLVLIFVLIISCSYFPSHSFLFLFSFSFLLVLIFLLIPSCSYYRSDFRVPDSIIARSEERRVGKECW